MVGAVLLLSIKIKCCSAHLFIEWKVKKNLIWILTTLGPF